MTNKLYLADFVGSTEKLIKDHIAVEYRVNPAELKKYTILIAYESVGNWGCDSNSWFLLKDKTAGLLYEAYGSHDSCCGFEDQFEPEETSLLYLKSDKFMLYTGGYDDESASNKTQVSEFIRKMRA